MESLSPRPEIGCVKAGFRQLLGRARLGGVQMFEGDEGTRRDSFEPSGPPPLPGSSAADGFLAMPGEGYRTQLLRVAAGLAGLGLLVLALAIWAQSAALPALAALLLGGGLATFLLAALALLAWWRWRHKRSAP